MYIYMYVYNEFLIHFFSVFRANPRTRTTP